MGLKRPRYKLLLETSLEAYTTIAIFLVTSWLTFSYLGFYAPTVSMGAACTLYSFARLPATIHQLKTSVVIWGLVLFGYLPFAGFVVGQIANWVILCTFWGIPLVSYMAVSAYPSRKLL